MMFRNSSTILFVLRFLMPSGPRPSLSSDHNCDLFLLSSHANYYADRSLAEFGIRGNRNLDGWGVGTFVNGNPHILKSEKAAVLFGDLSKEFAAAIRATSGSVILGHLRLTSHGSTALENNHPFELSFLGSSWLLIHNGTSRNHEVLVPPDEQILVDATNDTPRIFEFLRSKMIDYCLSKPKRSLIESCRSAYTDLLRKDPQGTFNLILSNGYLSFVFIHWRAFYLLQREKGTGNVAIISTIRLNDDEEWLKFDKLSGKKAKMLVFCGPDLVFNGDIPR